MPYIKHISEVDYYNNAATIYNFFINTAKMTPAQAAGMLAQADAESTLNPWALGDKDTAYGLFQIHKDRAGVIFKATGIDLTKYPPVQDQLTAVWWELKNVLLEKQALAKILATNTPYDAGYVACLYYERAGAPGQPEKRGANAAVWFKYFNPPAANTAVV